MFFVLERKQFKIHELAFHVPEFVKLINFDFQHPVKEYDQDAPGYRALFHIAYMFDALSPYRNLMHEEKKEFAYKAAFENKQRSKCEAVLASQEYKDARDVYCKLIMRPAERVVMGMRKQMDGFANYLNNTEISDDPTQINSILKVFDQAPEMEKKIRDMEDMIYASEENDRIHGGSRLSLLEKVHQEDFISMEARRYE